MRGEVFAIAAAILWGLVPVIDKIALSSGVSIYTANVIRSIGAATTIITLSVLTSQLQTTVDLKTVACLLVGGAIAGAFAVILYFSAIKTIGASRTVPITAAYPMFTAIISILVLGESISLKVAVGIVLIVIGIILVSEI